VQLCYRRAGQLGTLSKATGSIICAVLAGASFTARAAEQTRVVTGAGGHGELPEVLLDLTWVHEDRKAGIAREHGDATTGGKTLVKPDLFLHETRNVLAFRGEVGLFRDLSLFLELPFVLSDERELSFDRDESCNTAQAGTLGCVDQTNATIFRDGILPAGSAGYGLDAQTGQRFQAPVPYVFRSPKRSGLAYLGVGLSYALMSQRRDDTKPTWIVRFEPRFSLADAVEFDPAHPDANHSVGPGYHQYVFSTLFSRRFEHFDPYLSASYLLPQTKSSSPFDRFTLGSNGFAGPQHVARIELGAELQAYDNPGQHQRVTLEVRGSAELRFFGLAQGELWEPLSGRSDCATSASACRAGVDRDFNGDGKLDPHPGVTRSPSYGVLGASGGFNIQPARHFRMRALFGITREQDRLLTDGRSGAEAFDLPGRRFVVRDAGGWSFTLDAGCPF
jgi:hypothetical protein